MDKHTKRYMFERFGHCYETFNSLDALYYLNQASSEQDFTYLSFAAQEIDDDVFGKIFREQLIKKQLGWD